MKNIPPTPESLTPQDDILSRTYEVYDHNGNIISDPAEYSDQVEVWRHETRQAVLDAFPEQQVTSVINPITLRKQLFDLGTRSSPVAVIPNTEEATQTLLTILQSNPTLAGNAFDGIENGFDSYNSLVANSTDLDIILFVDPTNRINAQEDEVEAAIDEEFSRMILAHELGHSSVRAAEKTRVELDATGAITHVYTYISGFGLVSEPIDLAEDNYWEGSILEEGYATLVASTLYHGLDHDVVWRIPNKGELLLPGWLFSSVEAYPDEHTADNHALAAWTLAKYDEKYPGFIQDMKRLANQEIGLEEFVLLMDSRDPGLYDRLQSAVHEKSHVATAKAAGIVIYT